MKTESLIINCHLCKESSLHLIGEGIIQTQQCIHCGYVSSEKFKLKGKKKEEHDEYKKLPEDMQKWSKVAMDRVWIPTLLTLPSGMLYPIKDKGKDILWAFAKMVKIPENERKNYPVEGYENQFYKQMFDTENHKVYDTFFEAMLKVYEKPKDGQTKGIQLPKLKKM
jgi:ribosomal protein L37E|tara:strand:- start:727 stop:1227 length:501 start_codon:yes stop_codon:yes gene_type:complete